MAEPCLKENILGQIKSDLQNITGRIDKHDDKIDKLAENNVALARLTTILDEMREDNKAQAVINKEITTTLSDIRQTIKVTDGKIETLKESQDKANLKLGEMEEKINKVDSKSKIDLLEMVKKNWIPVLFGAGGIGGLVTLIAQLIK